MNMFVYSRHQNCLKKITKIRCNFIRMPNCNLIIASTLHIVKTIKNFLCLLQTHLISCYHNPQRHFSTYIALKISIGTSEFFLQIFKLKYVKDTLQVQQIAKLLVVAFTPVQIYTLVYWGWCSCFYKKQPCNIGEMCI